MLSPHVKEKMALLVQWDPWTWIALLYASQFSGAIPVAIAFGLSTEEMSIPIALLMMGTLHAVAARFNPKRKSPGTFHDWLPAIIYCLFIFSLSHESFRDVDVSFNVNFFHPLEYAVLAIFFCWMGHTMLPSKGVAALIMRVLAGGIAFAVLDELHQSFIPGRTPSFIDLLLDFMGLSIGCAIFFTGRHLRRSLTVGGMGARDIS
ncbi:MAG: VanZ family protein [Desulfoferrobacter sp.]